MAITDPTVPPKKRGCLFYGCLITSIVCVIGLALTILGVRAVYKKAVADFTTAQPETIQKGEIAPADLTALQARVERFEAALQNPKEQQELILTADDINALIANNPEFKSLAGKVYVMIEGDQVRSQVSVPLKDIGPLKFKGRYLNGVATIGLGLENGKLRITLQDVQVKGQSLPATIMTELKKQNWARDVQNDRGAANAIKKFESIKVEDGKVILKSKAPEAVPAPTP